MDAIEAGQPPKIFGDGLQSMDFVYVEDVARANVAGLVADATDEVFNVGMGVETTLNELCRMLLKVSGSNLKPEYHEARKVNNVRARRATTEKAEKMLGFKANVDLETGLKLLIEWREQTRSELASAVGGAR
jgi:UDP-glucose 4-epimerase